MKICAQKLVRAEKLIGGLGGEKDRWSQAAVDLQAIYDNLLGNVLISAGVIAYLGPFTTAFREKCTGSWVRLCKVKHFSSRQWSNYRKRSEEAGRRKLRYED